MGTAPNLPSQVDSAATAQTQMRAAYRALKRALPPRPAATHCPDFNRNPTARLPHHNRPIYLEAAEQD